MLKDIKYRAKLIGIVPMRYFLYFSIELILFRIYKAHGPDKVDYMRSKTPEHLIKEITTAIIDFICEFKVSEKLMVCRILKAVFLRLAITQNNF